MICLAFDCSRGQNLKKTVTPGLRYMQLYVMIIGTC
jgi:hypothetical protein